MKIETQVEKEHIKHISIYKRFLMFLERALKQDEIIMEKIPRGEVIK